MMMGCVAEFQREQQKDLVNPCSALIRGVSLECWLSKGWGTRCSVVPFVVG